MSQASTPKLVVRSIFGGLCCLSLIDQLFSYSVYESCTHKTINIFNMTLVFWWIKAEKFDKGVLPVLVAMIEAVFLLGSLDGHKLEGCSNHTFESSIPQFYNVLILTTLWLDGILLLVLTGFLTCYLLYQCAKDLISGESYRVANRYGLTEKQKKELYSNVYKKITNNEENEDCPVCLLEMKEGEEVIDMPKCNHRFHVTCLDNWVSQHATCPYCRESIGNII